MEGNGRLERILLESRLGLYLGRQPRPPLACQSSIFLGAGRRPVLASKKMLAT
jgi:hypothetical protein